MEFAFPWPYSQGEWLAWVAAAVTALVGLVFLFAPRTALRFLHLMTAPERPEALAEPRATIGGFYLGIGLSAILFAQPLIYLALGIAWGIAAFGRLISMMSDRGNTLRNWILLALSALMAALPLAFATGFIA